MPNYIEVPDLLFKGAKVYTLEVVPATVPTPPSTPTAPTQQGGFGSGTGGGFKGSPATPTPPTSIPSPGTTYPIGLLTLEDAMFLFNKDIEYKHLVPNHQLHFDILSLNGLTYWQMPPNSLSAAAFKTRINQVINWAGSDHSAETASFDTAAYKGPLLIVYLNLVRQNHV